MIIDWADAFIFGFIPPPPPAPFKSMRATVQRMSVPSASVSVRQIPTAKVMEA